MAGKGINRRSKFILPLKLQLQYDLIKDLKLHLVIQGLKISLGFEVFPTGIYLFKVKNGNNRTMCDTCSKFSIKTPERRQ